MAIEQIHVINLHTFQTLVERGHQILAAAPIAIRAGPHVIAGFRRDEQFVAIGPEVLVHQSSHRLLGRTIDRTIVVSQVEMRDAVVEGIMGNLPASLIWIHAAEIMPKAETHLWQHHTRAPTALKLHPVVVAALVREIQFSHISIK